MRLLALKQHSEKTLSIKGSVFSLCRSEKESNFLIISPKYNQPILRKPPGLYKLLNNETKLLRTLQCGNQHKFISMAVVVSKVLAQRPAVICHHSSKSDVQAQILVEACG